MALSGEILTGLDLRNPSVNHWETILNIFVKAIAALTLLISLPVNAVIIGDKDWRQLTDITGFSWNDFDAVFDTSTGACDTVGCLVGGSLNLTGYTWASTNEVNDLFMFYTGGTGLDSLTLENSIATGTGALDGLFVDFNPTFQLAAIEFRLLAGWTRDSSLDGKGHMVWANQVFSATSIGFDFIRPELGELIKGGWVYSTVSESISVPEPSIIVLFGLGLLGFGFASRCKIQS